MQKLNEKFGIPNIARFEVGQGGLTKLRVTGVSTAEIYLHGAHVAQFQPPGHKPVLWMSKSSWFDAGRPIRGGVPICFPWFGPRQGDPAAPGHGFARLREWTVESIVQKSDGAVAVCLMLESDDATRAWWPVDFTLRHTITIGSSLEMKLDVQNRSPQTARFEQALHTYFTVGDVRHVSIEGLGGVSYVDKVGGVNIRRQVEPVIRFTGETDRVYQDTQSTCVIDDPVLLRRIELAKSGSNATVVWNPWIAKAKAMPDYGDDEWPGMVCVETVNAGKNAVDLPAGQTHTMTATIRIV